MNYCSNCGTKLEKTHKFCYECGAVLSRTNLTKTKNKAFSYEFQSNIILGGDILNPDRLVVDENGVSFFKRNKYLIGVDRQFIPYRNISSVRIDRKLIDADVIISSYSGDKIVAQDFSISNAKKIEALVQEQLN
jgi:hypothetical protein